MHTYRCKLPSALTQIRQIEARVDPVVAFTREYPSGHLIERHRHERNQIIFASDGIMQVDTPRGIWVVPPMRAIWIPQHVEHELRTQSAVCLRTLFLRSDLRTNLPDHCCVIHVSPLLREIILRVAQLQSADPCVAPSSSLMHLLLDEMEEVELLPLNLFMPSDPRPLKVSRALLEDPADKRTCSQWARSVGASARTLERLFQKETAVHFGLWRRQVRLIAAMTRLAQGASIAAVSIDMGYQSQSAFSAMFKRSMGRPPSYFQRKYLAEDRGHPLNS